jgi:YVTN family beta-propeller protein
MIRRTSMRSLTRRSDSGTGMSGAFIGYLMAAVCAGAMLGAASLAQAADVSGLGVVTTIPGDDASFDYASVDPTARRLYVARGDGVMSIDLETLKVTPRFIPGKTVHAVVPLPGGRLLITNGESNVATIANAGTRTIMAEIPVGDEPDAAVYDPASKSAFVVDSKSGDLAVVDLSTRAVTTRIAIGGQLEAAVVDGNGHLYVNISDQSAIAVVDTRTLRIVARYALPGCQKPTGIGIDPESGVILSVCHKQKAVALHASDGTVIATIAIDRIPDAVIFDRQRRMFFVPCARDATMLAIAESPQGVSVTGRIATAIGAHTGALDPRTGRFYLPAADFSASVSGFKQHPGTFRVLVIGEK